MDWLERWNNNQIGWHRDNFNTRMVQYLPKLDLQQGDSIFVPLCGKSRDMMYLINQGYKVIGVELSSIAVIDFFTENDIEYSTQKTQDFILYIAENITIYQGDIFKLQKEHTRNINAIYDRASLVALNPQLRSEYAKLFNGIMPSGIWYLLLTLDYQQHAIDGPPFAVSETEVNALFKDWQIDKVDSFNDIENENKFQNNGLSVLNKETYVLKN